jgi:hypothetical protein
MGLTLASASLALDQERGNAGDGVARAISTGGGVQWQIAVSHAGGTLTVSGPDGVVVRRTFANGETPSLDVWSRDGKAMPDGNYRYELVLAPRVDAQAGTPTAADRAQGGGGNLGKGRVVSGSFAIIAGSVKVAGDTEPRNLTPAAVTPTAGGPTAPDDQVIADDLIVQGSICVGFDCVNNESFGFDTIRMKENSTRIKFEDTSVGAFPSNDWQLTANDSASGGANKFSIEDITGSRVPFTVTAGAATNSIFVDSTGRVGFRTSTPVLDLHVATSNTPAMRLEQTNAGGFTAQTWDVAGNEANFFVRDVTGGSRLPFRIRPGAPTSSIDINASGDVGIGTGSPGAKLDVRGSSVTSDIFVAIGTNPAAGPSFNLGYSGASFGEGSAFLNVRPDASAVAPNPSLRFATSNTVRMIIDNEGFVGLGTCNPANPIELCGTTARLTAGGVWQDASSRTLKHDIQPLDGALALSTLAALTPVQYRYNATPDDPTVGFIAEDVPDLVATPDHKALSAMDIVAVLTRVVQQQQATIDQLSKKVSALESRDKN